MIPSPIATNLTKQQARVIEQLAISAFTLDALSNMRREIGRRNLEGAKDSLGAAVNLFESISEDELYNLMYE